MVLLPMGPAPLTLLPRPYFLSVPPGPTPPGTVTLALLSWALLPLILLPWALLPLAMLPLGPAPAGPAPPPPSPPTPAPLCPVPLAMLLLMGPPPPTPALPTPAPPCPAPPGSATHGPCSLWASSAKPCSPDDTTGALCHLKLAVRTEAYCTVPVALVVSEIYIINMGFKETNKVVLGNLSAQHLAQLEAASKDLVETGSWGNRGEERREEDKLWRAKAPAAGLTGQQVVAELCGRQWHVKVKKVLYKCRKKSGTLKDPTISVDPTRWHIESGGLSFINSDVQTLLEMLITKRPELKVWKENIKNGSSFKQMSPDYTMYSLGNMLELMGSKRDTTAQTFWNTKEKPEQLHDTQDFSYHKDLRSPLEKKYSQLFWGLPSLHRESLVATAWVSKRSSAAQCKHVAFNIVSESLSVQHQDEETAQISQEELFSQEEAQSQLLAQNLSPSVAQGQTLSSTSYTFPNLPPSSSQIKPGTTTCSKSEKEEQPFFQTEEQHSECPLQNQRKVLFSEIQKTLEDLYQPALNLPQGSWASQISNSVSIVAGDSASQELENRLEQHIQGKLISDQPQLGPHCRFLASQEQMQPQDQYPRKSQCHKNDESGPSQSSQSALTDNDLQKMEQPSQSILAGHDLKKMETKHTERLSTMGSVTFKLDFPNKGLEPELQKQPVDISWSSGSTSGTIQNDNKEVSESYLRRNRKGIPESELSTGLDKKIVEKILQDHLSRKSVQIKEGMIPVCVRGSWLAANYAFPKSYMHTKPIYQASSKYQQSYVNTVQQLSFLDPGTHLKLETDIMRSRVRRRWSPSLQAFDPINYTLGEAQTSPLPQPAFSSSASSDYRAISIAKIGSLLEELPQKGQGKRVIRKISFPTLHNPLPALSPSEVQKTMRGTPLGGRHMTSDAYMPSDTYSHLDMNQQSTVFRGIGKPSLEPSLSLDMASYETPKQSKDVASGYPCPGATMLEIKVGTQSSTAKKTKETELEKKKSSEWEVTVEASVMANSQTINVNLKNVGSLGNMKSPSPSRISISQDPGDQNLKTKICSAFQVKVEVESEEQHQDQFTGVQQDCLTNELSTTDISHSGVSLSNSKSFCRIHKSISQALCDDVMKAGSSQEQEESKVTNVEVPGKNDTEMICLNKSQESFRRSRPREEEGSSLECGLSPSDKVKDIDTTSTKSFPCFPEKEQNPQISYCNIKMKDFVQSFNNHQKGKFPE
ncbi:spermatogenesis-associated protein 31E1-like [Marmota flaviventris]|uniref:spermatogenesis-associated protein 31E1-like n=1 Tax=Marmota flaviventris TaxID=93162 RepID=UPI003A8BE9E7